ncbi:MAG: hypothetical protein V1932_04710 [Chloroflexota bacterium]
MRASKLIDKPWKLVVLIILEVAVFTSASWLTIHVLSANEAILNAIVILSIFAVGISIILYGNVARNRNLNTLGFALFLFAVFVIIDKYEGFAVRISAFAALLVAFAAFAAIEENRRLRFEKRQQEECDRKERLLNEIIEWAEDITTFSIDADVNLYLNLLSVGGKSKKEQEVERSHRAILLSRILSISKKTEYMNIVTTNIRQELNNASIEVAEKEVVENLNNCIAVLRKGLTDKVSTTEVGLSTQRLSESSNKLIEEATNIKIHLSNAVP